jgi:hypothetical protein
VLHSPGLNSFLIDPPACVCCEGEGKKRGAGCCSSSITFKVIADEKEYKNNHTDWLIIIFFVFFYSVLLENETSERACALSPVSRFLNWKVREKE